MPVSRQVAEQLAQQVTDLYRAAEQRMLERIASNLRKGLDRPQWAEEKLAQMRSYRRQTQALIKDLEEEARTGVQTALTEAYDRGRKFEHYRQIPTLQAYLLVSQQAPRVEQFIRQAEGRWLLDEAAGVDRHLDLPSLQTSISLAEVFANVSFTHARIRPPMPAS